MMAWREELASAFVDNLDGSSIVAVVPDPAALDWEGSPFDLINELIVWTEQRVYVASIDSRENPWFVSAPRNPPSTF